MTYIQDNSRDILINECMRMVYDKDFPKEFEFTRHTTKIERLGKLRKFREFWYIKCPEFNKQEAIEAFINNEKTTEEKS